MQNDADMCVKTISTARARPDCRGRRRDRSCARSGKDGFRRPPDTPPVDRGEPAEKETAHSAATGQRRLRAGRCAVTRDARYGRHFGRHVEVRGLLRRCRIDMRRAIARCPASVLDDVVMDRCGSPPPSARSRRGPVSRGTHGTAAQVTGQRSGAAHGDSPSEHAAHGRLRPRARGRNAGGTFAPGRRRRVRSPGGAISARGTNRRAWRRGRIPAHHTPSAQRSEAHRR